MSSAGGPSSSGALSLVELRRHLVREASVLASRADRVRVRGERALATALDRRSQRLVRVARRIRPGEQ